MARPGSCIRRALMRPLIEVDLGIDLVMLGRIDMIIRIGRDGAPVTD